MWGGVLCSLGPSNPEHLCLKSLLLLFFIYAALLECMKPLTTIGGRGQVQYMCMDSFFGNGLFMAL